MRSWETMQEKAKSRGWEYVGFVIHSDMVDHADRAQSALLPALCSCEGTVEHSCIPMHNQ